MSIRGDRELGNTRKKLQLLEDRLDEQNTEPVTNPQTRELTRRWLKKLANQLKEEIARFRISRRDTVGRYLRPLPGLDGLASLERVKPSSNRRWLTLSVWAARRDREGDPAMTEDQAKRIAFDFVAKSKLDPCELDSIQWLSKSSLGMPNSTGDDWVVRFAFELLEDVACSSEMAIVLVDDTTGEPRLCESL